MHLILQPGIVQGTVQVPPSKSHSMRALLLGGLSAGTSVLHNLLCSPDVSAMSRAVRQWGGECSVCGEHWTVAGTSGLPHLMGHVDAGNSGQVLRFVTACGALGDAPFTMGGDQSIQRLRPVDALVSGLRQLGVRCATLGEGGRPPLHVQGPLCPGSATIDGRDSQPVSALLMALSCAKGPSELRVQELGERPWVGLTLWWLRRLGAQVTWHQGSSVDLFHIEGGWCPPPFTMQIPGDWSAAAFLMGAGLLTGRVMLQGLSKEDAQGDAELVSVLQNMGGLLHWVGNDLVAEESVLRGGVVDGNSIIDAVPILCALAPYTEQGIRVERVGIARVKESDRIAAMAEGLSRMGAQVHTGPDWVHVFPGELKGADVDAYGDHRIAMAFAVAALRARGATRIQGAECIEKSFPSFVATLQQMGGKVELEQGPVSCLGLQV